MAKGWWTPDDAIKWLHETGEVWDIGQLSDAATRALDRLCRKGQATKEKALFPYRTHGTCEKTLWVLAHDGE